MVRGNKKKLSDSPSSRMGLFLFNFNNKHLPNYFLRFSFKRYQDLDHWIIKTATFNVII